MNNVRASMTVLVLLSAGIANFVGCTPDEPPPDTTSSTGTGSSSGVPLTCGDGKLDMGEDCDDGNNSPADGCTTCKVDECFACSNASGELSTCTPATAGTACQSDANKVCDGATKCVDCVDNAQCTGGYCHNNVCAKCDDGMKNGDETDTDCGGMNCPACVDGKLCMAGTDCANTFCVDNRCCADACEGECQACNIPGSEGTCDLVPQYGEDSSYMEAGSMVSCLAADGKACNGGGTCAAAIGQTCTGPAQCASTKCFDNDGDMTKTCVKATGEACAMNNECQSNMCDTATMLCL